jgi:hypothetical protein
MTVSNSRSITVCKFVIIPVAAAGDTTWRIPDRLLFKKLQYPFFPVSRQASAGLGPRRAALRALPKLKFAGPIAFLLALAMRKLSRKRSIVQRTLPTAVKHRESDAAQTRCIHKSCPHGDSPFQFNGVGEGWIQSMLFFKLFESSNVSLRDSYGRISLKFQSRPNLNVTNCECGAV